jgi:REP element-mobilizing transposase RayT
MRRRYFGIQTTWYSVRYAPCPDNRISIHDMLPHIASATFTHGQARGTLPFGLLDAMAIMPNHVHGVIIVPGRGTACRAPTTEQFGKPAVGSVPTIVRSYKSSITRRINLLRGAPDMPVWQRGYHEHIVRNEQELTAIREYILGNPAQWDEDENNPACPNSGR